MLNQDQLGKIPDDDLHRRYKTVKGWIVSRKFSTSKTRHLEIELCYIHRESEIRESRREHHRRWIAELRNSSSRRTI